MFSRTQRLHATGHSCPPPAHTSCPPQRPSFAIRELCLEQHRAYPVTPPAIRLTHPRPPQHI
ncbi:hypothetical protein BD413DRAFT_528462 [Trametes elegans]|nr:hypothetical protein BD413DRAFT_528462 [Trametes elegans]